MVGPDYKTPASDVAPGWLPSPGVEEKPLNAADAYWWKIFQDPVLDRLVETAYRSNLSLQIAGARVLQARAQLNQSIGNLFPQQQGISGAIAYDRTGTPITVNRWDDNLLFSATWEIDVWGKIRRGIESDRAAYLSSVASYDDALVTVIADVASSYVNIRTAEERLRVADAQRRDPAGEPARRLGPVQVRRDEPARRPAGVDAARADGGADPDAPEHPAAGPERPRRASGHHALCRRRCDRRRGRDSRRARRGRRRAFRRTCCGGVRTCVPRG